MLENSPAKSSFSVFSLALYMSYEDWGEDRKGLEM
jgi:hypothetical protein